MTVTHRISGELRESTIRTDRYVLRPAGVEVGVGTGSEGRHRCERTQSRTVPGLHRTTRPWPSTRNGPREPGDPRDTHTTFPVKRGSRGGWGRGEGRTATSGRLAGERTSLSSRRADLAGFAGVHRRHSRNRILYRNIVFSSEGLDTCRPLDPPPLDPGQLRGPLASLARYRFTYLFILPAIIAH